MAWVAAGICLSLAIVAGLGARRRRLRVDPDRVGWIDWPTVQMLALIGLAVAVGLGLRS